MAVDTAQAPLLRIWGLCPKCSSWFDCDAWFDRSQPTPCCPRCALGPSTIRYEHPARTEAVDHAVSTEWWLG